jgi:replicative superfamily II helicase
VHLCVFYVELSHCVFHFCDRYVMGIDEAEAFSERLKRELTALEAANVHAILESEPLVEEVCLPISKHLFLCPGSSVKF